MVILNLLSAVEVYSGLGYEKSTKHFRLFGILFYNIAKFHVLIFGLLW